MSLLELIDVRKRHTNGGRAVTVLEHASLSLGAGELVAVWGLRGSGRTTLLRLAAGIDAPDAGTVSFDGRDLARHGEEILGREIGYCQKAFRTAGARTALGEILVGLLVNGIAPTDARLRAAEALERVVGSQLGARQISECDSGERTRVALAHALALRPRLLVIDEPVAGVELHQRDAILQLLRALADDGLAVLMTVGDLTGLSGADQALTIGEGELSSGARIELAPVLPLRPAATADLRASG